MIQFRFNFIKHIASKSSSRYFCTRFYSRASSKRWLDRQKQDFYTRESKLDSLRSRAGFKLAQLDDVYHIFDNRAPQNILDLGFAPGAWSQMAHKRSHADSVILGVDILPCDPPFGVSAMQANILSKRTHAMIRQFFLEHNVDRNEIESSSSEKDSNVQEVMNNVLPVDVIISDMYEPFPPSVYSTNNLTNMPYYRMSNTSGLAVKDHLNSIDLCDAALITAIDLLKPGGFFVCKQFMGSETTLYEKRMRKVFSRVERSKPAASRDESKEIYFIGKYKKRSIDKIDVFSN